jgi:hypothetical protein
LYLVVEVILLVITINNLKEFVILLQVLPWVPDWQRHCQEATDGGATPIGLVITTVIAHQAVTIIRVVTINLMVGLYLVRDLVL